VLARGQLLLTASQTPRAGQLEARVDVAVLAEEVQE
jgi:hypothetical protein